MTDNLSPVSRLPRKLWKFWCFTVLWAWYRCSFIFYSTAKGCIIMVRLPSCLIKNLAMSLVSGDTVSCILNLGTGCWRLVRHQDPEDRMLDGLMGPWCHAKGQEVNGFWPCCISNLRLARHYQFPILTELSRNNKSVILCYCSCCIFDVQQDKHKNAYTRIDVSKEQAIRSLLTRTADGLRDNQTSRLM